MVRMLLKAGAGQSTQKVLERGAQNGNNRGGLQTRGIALHSLLSKHACKGEFVEREIWEDVHKITELLLEHGADPDVELPWRASCFTSPTCETTRELGYRNPDPRVRNLFHGECLVPLAKPATSSIRAGRLISRPDESLGSFRASPEDMMAAGKDYSMKLWDFVKKSDEQNSTLQDDAVPEKTDTVNASKWTWSTYAGSDKSRSIGASCAFDFDFFRQKARSIGADGTADWGPDSDSEQQSWYLLVEAVEERI
ncbi:hypothetical protein IQ06DRAFT_349585 [Phaeosphaeriaceae sp. SRC1lsM3a]|nr:hypothetical protein IQ06DRAFT_349585 [Stagonospora sp. SRC1lsM3a]